MSGASGAFAFTDIMNVPMNLAKPFISAPGGALAQIAAEVVTAKILRRFINAPPVGWAELAYIHTVSIPFLGGPVGFVEPNQPMNESDWTRTAQDGAKGIPAVLLAQYIVATAMGAGFHLPTFNMLDLLLTAGAKTLTRPMLSMVAQYFPRMLADQYVVLNRIIQNQARRSNLAS